MSARKLARARKDIAAELNSRPLLLIKDGKRGASDQKSVSGERNNPGESSFYKQAQGRIN